MHAPVQDPRSILFITLDSCRYDTFAAADAPNLKAVGDLHRAMAPGNFTYGSHAAMFVGFTPGIAARAEPFVNPKFGKIFKIAGGGFPGKGTEFMTLTGRNIVDGLKRKGYLTLGSGAVGWFDPKTETGRHLTQDFDRFYFSGGTSSLPRQLEWIEAHLDPGRPVFIFLNVGETHVPYHFEGASWDPGHNPCVPFSPNNDAGECRRRQQACLGYVDAELAPLLEAFSGASTIVCADHGDCWGEDGLWEHGIHHEKVLEVPLLFRLSKTRAAD
ncbi:hypothetical protein GALL_109870 [mine drainage metagenome]|uniref:Sulfatase N-terminal domain-containing protein n=1 Tax=mine drainage metagenome TaxID=410659 RepID=A0A1J5SFP2_9ZZZZ